MGLRDRVRAWSAEGRALAELGRLVESGRADAVVGFAASASFAVQRAARAAFAAGALPAPGLVPGLPGAPPRAAPLTRLPPPRADEDHLLEALAAVRAGAEPGAARAPLAARDARTLFTAFGLRAPARALAVAPLAARFDTFVADAAQPREAARAALRARLAAAPEDAAAWLRLAALRHPDDASALAAARANAGRRADHLLLDAVAVHGGAAALPALRGALHARDVDPGRGFTQRRVAADGLGRLGEHAGVDLLRRALRDESADFEGRPGAGLGVQYPVRANLLWALGELGDPGAADALCPLLGETQGSAFGGFYLPAMDALVRLGPAVAGAVGAVADSADAIAAANAVGVLRALGLPVDRWRARPEPVVRAALEGS